MGKETGISWTNHTFNTHWGCEQISPACDNCYAKAWSERTGHGKSLPVIWGADTERRFFGEKHWNAPLAWNRDAEKAGKPALVFVNSMSDTFEDRRDLDPLRARLWGLSTVTRWLRLQLLTKRPHLAHAVWERASQTETRVLWPRSAWLSNHWIGTTVEDRAHGVPRIAHLRAIPAAVRFLSCEPLLEDLGDLDLTGIHQVIVGGESGGNARGFDVAWAARLRDQCREQRVAFFMKQYGSRPFERGVGLLDNEGDVCPIRLNDRKHRADMSEFHEALRVREYPKEARA